jgi:hypothetical protein
MSYTPHPAFVTLYDSYTGPGSIAADLAILHAQDAKNRPLLASTGSDLVLFPGGGASPVFESFRLSTRGFKELTAVSHLGTAVAWLVAMRAEGDDRWRARAEALICQCREVRAISRVAYFRDVARVSAWTGLEQKICDLVDYACRVTEAFLARALLDPSCLTYAVLCDDYLDPKGSAAVPVPFNDVMVATFSLTFLDITHRILGWLWSQNIDWPQLLVMITGSSGRPTAGLTWATNNMCPLIWQASRQMMPVENLLIAPHLPGIDMQALRAGENQSRLEADYRLFWSKTKVTAEMGAKMFPSFPAFVPDIGAKAQIDSAAATRSDMPQLRHSDDRHTAIARLKRVMEDPRQLLSNSVSQFIIDSLCQNDNQPGSVIVPCFTNTSHPAAH